MKNGYKVAIFLLAAFCGFGIYMFLSSRDTDIELSTTAISEPPGGKNSMKTVHEIDYVVHFKRSDEGTEDGSFTVSLVTDDASVVSKNPDGGFTLVLDGLEERDIDLEDFRKTLMKWAKIYSKKHKKGTFNASLEELAELYIKILDKTLSSNVSFLLSGEGNQINHILRKRNMPDFVTGGSVYLESKIDVFYILLSNLVLRYIHKLFIDNPK